MAAHIHKVWNAVPSVIPEGVSIKFSANNFYLYVLDAQGAEIAKFRSQVVRDYWVESSAADNTIESASTSTTCDPCTPTGAPLGFRLPQR